MPKVCLYFQVHQPYRLKHYNVFSVGKDHDYFNRDKNKEVLERVSEKCYKPMNELLLSLIQRHGKRFKVSFSITGTAMEQLQDISPQTFLSFQKLAKTGNVSFLSETYYHSLSFLYSREEFDEQVKMHSDAVQRNFGVLPRIFRNTELIYNNELATHAMKMGYAGVLSEGPDHVLGWRTPDFAYSPKGAEGIKLLLKNYRLSDDIAFRYSDKGWSEYPLTAKKYAKWIKKNDGDFVNLFMDYETFGEHHWEDTGIFTFFEGFVDELLKENGNSFISAEDAIGYESAGEMDIHCPISWSDRERDLSAWCGNRIQDAAIKKLYELEKEIKESGDQELIRDWRRLSTSDHFYYMCTKHFNDGDVHNYFSPYNSPYDSFINFMNIMNDLAYRLKADTGAGPKERAVA